MVGSGKRTEEVYPMRLLKRRLCPASRLRRLEKRMKKVPTRGCSHSVIVRNCSFRKIEWSKIVQEGASRVKGDRGCQRTWGQTLADMWQRGRSAVDGARRRNPKHGIDICTWFLFTQGPFLDSRVTTSVIDLTRAPTDLHGVSIECR